MNTRTMRQRVMSDDTGAATLSRSGIQELFSKEFQKIGVEIKAYKQEIITAVEN